MENERDDIRSRLLRYRFTYLLVAQSLLLLVAPIVHECSMDAEPVVAKVLLAVFFEAILLAALLAVSRTRKTTVIALLLSSPAIVLQVVTTTTQLETLYIVQHASRAAFLLFVMSMAVRLLFTVRTITFDTIMASLCVYLLLGIMWTSLYSLIDLLDEQAFASSTVLLESSAPREAPGRVLRLLYFSFVTLTTLGYGDIAPASAVAQMFAVAEAMAGQAFLVVLVARLVGMYASQTTDPR